MTDLAQTVGYVFGRRNIILDPNTHKNSSYGYLLLYFEIFFFF